MVSPKKKDNMSDNKIEIKSEYEEFPTPSPKKVNTQLSEVENTSSVEIKDTSMLHSSSIKKVVVTGVTGQDGSHMVEYLLKNTNCMVYGTIRRLSVSNHENIEHLKKEPRFQLVNLDLTDDYSIRDVIVDLQPDYFLNFAAQSFVDGSWDYPIQT